MQPGDPDARRGQRGHRGPAAPSIRSWVLAGAFAGAFLGAPAPLRALDPALPLGTQAQRVWRSEDGLLQDTATALLEDRDGFLWIGTEEGLARFDGVRFDHLSRTSHPALPHPEVRCLAQTPDGSLWIGSSEPGLHRYRDGLLTAFGPAEGLPESPIRILLRDRAGRLWAAPAEGPLLRLEGDRFLPQEGDRTLRIRALAEDAEGTLWVGTERSGLWKLQGGRLSLAALAPGEICALAAGPDGQVWVGTRTHGLLGLDAGRLAPPGWARGLPARPVTALLADRQGSLWIGFEQAGLFRRGPQGRLEAAPDALGPRGTVTALLEDRTGALWSAREDRGLQALHAVPFQALPTGKGEGGEPIRMVCQDAAGRVWCLLGNQTLATLREGRIQPFGPTGLAGSDPPTALWPGRAGGLWIGTRGGGIHLLEEGKRRPAEREGPRSGPIGTLYEDPAGTLWAATGNRDLVKLPREGPPHLFPAVGAVVALAGGGPGPLYLASPTRGLGLLEGGRVRWLGRAEGLGSAGARSLHLDARGDLWVGTADGLRLFREGAFRTFREPRGPLALGIHAILEDARERLWLSTSQGTFRLARAALLRSLEAPGPLPHAAFDQRDGLPAREGQGGPQPVAWAAREGDLFLATSRGLARTDGRSPAPTPPPLGLHLLKVLCDEAEVPVQGPLALSPGLHRLEFQYTGISLTAPEKVRFRHRLEGLEPAWNEVGDRRFAVYPSLPPGTYRFILQAWRPEDEGPPRELAFAVTIRPYYHQRPLFWVAAGAALLAFGWWLVRLRLQQAEARTAVLDERNRMAREIHDHLAQGFTGVLLQLEAAEAKLAHLGGDPEPVLTRLDHARNLATSSLQEARRSVMALHPHPPEGMDLLGALRTLADRLLAGTEIQVELTQVGQPKPLGRRQEGELLRMAQEALTNALRHGKARRVRVVLQYDGGEVHLGIEDDGRGFDPSAATAGYGMRSIRESLRQLRGRMEVDSSPGSGTRITFTLPLRRWRP